ncbi:WASH complex subunit CCDC53 [Monocercomonoides exilis]|uniref:WASH complex subunit CCDC53 n=1 Tax=Monocercomonoides exilis TaxID=2049356 RepID=UPI00355A80A0|nr:WASH complex subunit CCDC53 [Monocercomonoides exilis]|eukprot:MONOS_3871.1-p1 / transcript=MONOS_3871.1 / gene=MONOS_3871 / organism=Monocercomonoides_exilis_PA203 / gene_product= WASH complex subunit CCDC53 / transcript_product= WASH complex subunit CCDC53 / location=Mono_scaffold00095:73073-73957(-) / protein_length=224 / sequence_SO=supercontig / SO=protein_coding / is_pseudo=false
MTLTLNANQPDLTKVESAPIEKVIVHFNNFIISTTHHLNKFISTCDQKLSDVSTRIYRIEATLANLEKKLASIPDSTLSAPPPSAAPPTTSAAVPQAPPLPDGSTIPPPPALPTGAPNVPMAPPLPGAPVEAPPVEAAPPEDPYPLVFARPYKTYYTMLKVKIPAPAVRMKALGAGEDMDEFDEFIKQVQKKFPGGSLPPHPLEDDDNGGDDDSGDDDDDDDEM